MNTSHYEALYIVPASLSDDEVQAIADQYKGVVEKLGGTVESAGRWEKRKLAYEIAGHKEGNYIMMLFEAPTAVPAELNRQMRNNETIFRLAIYTREVAAG